MAFEVFNVFTNDLLASHSFIQNSFGKRVISSFDVIIDHIPEKRTSHSNRHMQSRQLLLCIFFSGQISEIQYFEYLFAEDRSKLSPIISIQSQAPSNREILISLTELTDSTTSKDFILSGLEVRFCD